MDLKRYFESIWPGRGKDNLPRGTVLHAEQHFWETYGGPWHFNQAVGWVRLFVIGFQIRGDLWLSNAKRLMRKSRHRHISLMGKAFELNCRSYQSSSYIYQAVLAALNDFQKELRNGRLVFDLECFSNLGPHIDWLTLLGIRTNA